MARLVDPATGKLYDGVPPAMAESHGLVSEEQYQKDQAYEAKPLAEKGIDTLAVTANQLARPILAADDALGNLAAGGVVPNAPGPGGASVPDPLSPESAELDARHPIAAGVGMAAREAALAPISGIPGAVARVGTAALLGSADASFARGEGYVPNARDALTYGGLQAAFEGAAGVGGLVSRYLRSNRPALEQAAERAEGFAATARTEGDAAVKAERYAAEAPLHFDRLAKEGAEAVDGVSRAVVDVDQALTGLKVEANEVAAQGAAADVRNALKAELDANKALPAGRTELEPVPTLPDGREVSLVGKSLQDLGQSSKVGMKQESLDFLRQDERFLRTGKGVNSRLSDEALEKGGLGHIDGIILEPKGEGFYLRDGRHRLTVARERGMSEIFGRVISPRTSEVLYEGMIPVAARGPRGVPGQAEAGQRALAEIRASLGLGEKPAPVPDYARVTPKSSLEAQGGKRPGAGKKLADMSPEAATEARSNLEQQAAIGRKTPFTPKKAGGSVAETRQTMARVLDLLDETEPKNLYAVLRDSRNALSGLEGSAQSVAMIDEALQRVDVFGKAAEQYTAATSAGVLRAREAWESVQKTLAPGGSVSPKALRKLVEDPAAHAGLRADVQTALEGLDASVDLLRRGGKPAVLKQAQKAAAQLRGVLDEADEVAGAVRAQQLSGKSQQGLYARLAKAVAGKAGRMVGSVAGGIVGGWPGAVAGNVIGEALEEPAMALMARMNVYRARDIAQTARAMVYRAAPAAERAASRAARALPATGIGASAAYRAFAENYDSPQQAYAASIKAVNVAPEQLAASLGASLEGVPQEAQDAINLTAFQTQQFLKSKMPAGVGVSLMNPEGIPASRYSVSKWSLYYTAALNPSSVYKDLAAGRAQLEQIETLKALHPDDYNDLHDEAIRLVSSGARPSIKQRARLHLLFGIGAEVDPFFSQTLPAMIDNARKALAAKPRPQVNIPQSNSGAASRFASPQRTLETVQ